MLRMQQLLHSWMLPSGVREGEGLLGSSSESSVSGLFDFKESDSSDNPSRGSSDGSDSGNDDDEEEMECQAPDYPQEDSGDDMDAYALRSP